MVNENLVGPVDGRAGKSADRRVRGRSKLRNEKVIRDEVLILVAVGVFHAPQPVAVAEMLEVTQLRQGNTIRPGPEIRCNGWPAGLPGRSQHSVLKDV